MNKLTQQEIEEAVGGVFPRDVIQCGCRERQRVVAARTPARRRMNAWDAIYWAEVAACAVLAVIAIYRLAVAL